MASRGTVLAAAREGSTLDVAGADEILDDRALNADGFQADNAGHKVLVEETHSAATAAGETKSVVDLTNLRAEDRLARLRDVEVDITEGEVVVASGLVSSKDANGTN